MTLWKIVYPPPVTLDPRTCPTCGSAVWKLPPGVPAPKMEPYACWQYLADALEHYPAMTDGPEARAEHATLHELLTGSAGHGFVIVTEPHLMTLAAAVKSIRLAPTLGRRMAPFDAAVLKAARIEEPTPETPKKETA